jgi:hypothetical protein
MSHARGMGLHVMRCLLSGGRPANTCVGCVLVQILKHDWLVKEGVAYDISLDSVVLKRMKQFAQVRCLARSLLGRRSMHAAQQHSSAPNASMHIAAAGVALVLPIAPSQGTQLTVTQHWCYCPSSQMNKLKKMALMVVGQNLNTDELQGAHGRLLPPHACTAAACGRAQDTCGADSIHIQLAALPPRLLCRICAWGWRCCLMLTLPCSLLPCRPGQAVQVD